MFCPSATTKFYCLRSRKCLLVKISSPVAYAAQKSPQETLLVVFWEKWPLKPRLIEVDQLKMSQRVRTFCSCFKTASKGITALEIFHHGVGCTTKKKKKRSTAKTLGKSTSVHFICNSWKTVAKENITRQLLPIYKPPQKMLFVAIHINHRKRKLCLDS